MSDQALEFDRVTRRFGATVALRELDLAVEPGSVLGLVGRNGAGKTTSLRLAHGILHPDAGRIRVLGLDPTSRPIEVATRVSLLSEETHLYPWMTVGEILDFAGALHPGWDRELARSLSKRLELDTAPRIRTLSRGTRAKLALVLAASSRPELLLLDDPTAGLDPLVRRELLEGLLEAIPAEGGAVVYASHLIHDVERIADRVAVLDGGRLRLEGSLEELKRRVRQVTAVFDGGPPREVDLPGLIDLQADGRVLSAIVQGDDAALAERIRGLGASAVEVEPLSLEEILVGCLRGESRREVQNV